MKYLKFLTQYYSDILFLRGERAPKKRNFLVKSFQKVPKNTFFGLFFQIFACRAENVAKKGTKPCLGRAQKSIRST